MLNFRTDYLMAMRDQAPKMFNELRRSGAMNAHLDKKEEEARQLYVQLTGKGIEETPAQAAEAREQVYATLITFPPANETPEAA